MSTEDDLLELPTFSVTVPEVPRPSWGPVDGDTLGLWSYYYRYCTQLETNNHQLIPLLFQHPRCEVDLNDKDGNTAVHHARTPSVKWRLHNHSHRSRSMETVLCPVERTTNLCRVSPLAESEKGTPDDGEGLLRMNANELTSLQRRLCSVLKRTGGTALLSKGLL